jgi:ABC-type transport system substrate-binding protein
MNRIKDRFMFGVLIRQPAYVLLALGGLCLFAIAGAALRPEDTPRAGGLIRIREDGIPARPNLDPAARSWVFATEQVFEGLVRLNSKLDVMPALSEYWLISEDGRRMIFILKRGVKFHHGREMDSQDVKFSFERLLRRETQSPFAQLFTAKVIGAAEFREGKAADVSGFRAPEKFVFEIEWKNPYVSALYLLSMSFCKILPRDLVTDRGANFFWEPVGTGPYKFSYWIRTPRLDVVGVRLERFNQYHDRRPYLDVIEFSPLFTLDQFRDGDVHIMPFLSEGLAASGVQIVQGGLYNMTFLMLSCQNPPFDRIIVRKAIAAAIDKDRLARAMANPAAAFRSSANFIPPGLPGFFPLDERLTSDPIKARQLLADLGYLVEKNFPEVILYLPLPRTDASNRLGRELESQMEAIGVPLSVRYVASPSDVHDVRQPFMFLVPWAMDFPDAESVIQPLFFSASEFNRAAFRYSSAALDKLFDEAEVEKSWTRRAELFRKMERILGDEVPAVPLFFTEARFAVQSRLRGVRVPALGFHYLDARQIWLDKSERRP